MANGKQLSQKGADFILDLMDSYIDVKEAVTPCVVSAVNPVDDKVHIQHRENFLVGNDVARNFHSQGFVNIEVKENAELKEMRHFTKEEQKKYTDTISKLYKPTGVNIMDYTITTSDDLGV